ncbi:MAG: hypothetical protein ABIO82_03515 [Ginsengibacter sp.]
MEPGCDGVGDYLRRLSSELMRTGNEVAVIAIKDRHIQHYFDGSQSVEMFNLKVLRLPFSRPLGLHEERVSKWIDRFSPDFLSLQFVPFSFHRKGLLFGLNGYLKKISKGYRWHIMFHELWVGMATDSSLKLKVWGFIQKQMIRSLMRELKPEVVHTNTTLYQQQLKLQGVRAIHLPLFSNISFAKDSKIKKEDNTLSHSKSVFIVHFGLIHPGALITHFARETMDYGREKKINFILRIIGRGGSEQINWEKICANEGLETEILGEQSFETISEILSSAALGITTNPLELVEKSGSVAAMIEHGLPVLSVSKSWQAPKKIATKNPGGVLPFNLTNLQLSLENRNQVALKINTAKSVAEQFVHDLKSALN